MCSAGSILQSCWDDKDAKRARLQPTGQKLKNGGFVDVEKRLCLVIKQVSHTLTAALKGVSLENFKTVCADLVDILQLSAAIMNAK